jgi:heat shock protein HslJ
VRLLINAAAACLMATSAGATETDPAVVGKWVALEIRGRTVDIEPRPWVQFDGRGRAGGHDGCNHFGASIALEGGHARSNPASLKQTLIGCNRNEEIFTANLMVARVYEVTADQLILADEAGVQILRLQRAP